MIDLLILFLFLDIVPPSCSYVMNLSSLQFFGSITLAFVFPCIMVVRSCNWSKWNYWFIDLLIDFLIYWLFAHKVVSKDVMLAGSEVCSRIVQSAKDQLLAQGHTYEIPWQLPPSRKCTGRLNWYRAGFDGEECGRWIDWYGSGFYFWHCLIDWLVDWISDWSIYWAINWLINEMIDWLIYWIINNCSVLEANK